MSFTRKLLIGFILGVLITLVYISISSLAEYHKKDIKQNIHSYSDRNKYAQKGRQNRDKNNHGSYSEILVKSVESLAERVHGYIDTSRILDKANSYVKDEMNFNNIKQVDSVIASEIEELRQRGIDIKKDAVSVHKPSSQRTTLFFTTESITTEPVLETKQKVETTVVEHQLHKYRNPDDEDLASLTKEQVIIETATDPLEISATCPTEVYLLIMVISQPEHKDRRDMIRNAWAHSYQDDVKKLNKTRLFQDGTKYENENVFKVVFILGQSAAGGVSLTKEIEEEARLSKDLVIGNLQEDYKNLTMKTRLALKWAYYDCRSAFVVKTDDDVFINPVPLVEWLKILPLKKVYTGYCNFNSPVVRQKGNKWYVSPEDYSEKNYPGYCLGGGYLMSEDVLGAVLKLSYGRKLFPMEDLYVGLLVTELGNIQVNDQRIHFDLIYSGHTPVCKMNDLFLAHQVFGENQLTHIKNARIALDKC